MQIGTAFLRCPEAATGEMHRRALARASDEGTSVTAALTGRPARALTNRYVREMRDAAAVDLPDYPLIRSLAGPLGAAAARAGSDDFATMWAGQAAALGREMPAAELVAALMEEACTVPGRAGVRSAAGAGGRGGAGPAQPDSCRRGGSSTVHSRPSPTTKKRIRVATPTL